MIKIVVFVKQVPEVTDVQVDPVTGTLMREGVQSILNPFCEYALDHAAHIKQANPDMQVIAISMGPPQADAALVRCLELGADRAVLVTDRKFAGADTLATSYVIATVIQAIHEKDPIDVVFFGKQAIDGDTAQVGPGVAVRLDLPIITYAVKIRDIDLAKRQIVVERKTERWTEVVEAPLPALVTCEKEIAEVPFAPLPDLIRSLRYEPEVLTVDNAGIFDAEHIGVRGSPTVVFKMGTPPLPEAGEKVNSREIGVEAAVTTAFAKADAAGILTAVLGGAR